MKMRIEKLTKLIMFNYTRHNKSVARTETLLLGMGASLIQIAEDLPSHCSVFHEYCL